jgi:ribose 5-phosphate isomerase A
MNIDELKKMAAEQAVEYVESGMVVGLGTGSTTKFAILKIAELLKNGSLKNIVCIPTSIETERLAKELNIPLTDFSKNAKINITIDGADEVDENLNLIKGGGGALLREKIVAQATEREIIIVDESKLSKKLGEKWAVPIEVIKFAADLEKEFLESIGGSPVLRMRNGVPFVTDEGNYILDTNFGIIENPETLAGKLNSRAGIVEHGLFIGLAEMVIAAKNDGIEVIK